MFLQRFWTFVMVYAAIRLSNYVGTSRQYLWWHAALDISVISIVFLINLALALKERGFKSDKTR